MIHVVANISLCQMLGNDVAFVSIVVVLIVAVNNIQFIIQKIHEKIN